jgi:hypothetical protein
MIKVIDLKKVIEDIDHEYFNVNNLYEELPKDYNKIKLAGNTKNWIDIFHKNNYTKIIIDKNDLKWIKEANKLAIITGRFSEIYRDDLNDLVYKLQSVYGKNVNNGVFVRTEHVSLKSGKYGIGPYYNFETIIESICTTSRTHNAVDDSDECITIYLMKWIDLNPDKEFRIFVYNNNITGISIQHIYSYNKWINSLSTSDIELLIKNIKKYFNNIFKEKWNKTITSTLVSNYTFDLVLNKDNEFYFIEPNPFGSKYSAGSALFHWITDHDILHSSNDIEFRYTN